MRIFYRQIQWIFHRTNDANAKLQTQTHLRIKWLRLRLRQPIEIITNRPIHRMYWKRNNIENGTKTAWSHRMIRAHFIHFKCHTVWFGRRQFFFSSFFLISRIFTELFVLLVWPPQWSRIHLWYSLRNFFNKNSIHDFYKLKNRLSLVFFSKLNYANVFLNLASCLILFLFQSHLLGIHGLRLNLMGYSFDFSKVRRSPVRIYRHPQIFFFI